MKVINNNKSDDFENILFSINNQDIVKSTSSNPINDDIIQKLNILKN